MAPETVAKLTYEDYATLPNDGKRYEIIDGELYVNAAPVPRHQLVKIHLVSILFSYVRVHRAGILLDAPTDVLLGAGTVVQPDILFVARKNAAIVGPKNVQGAPDLVVEILSEGNRRHDELLKRRVYEQAQVGEYWIVDPELDLVKVDRLSQGAFARVHELTAQKNDVLESPLFHGLRIELAELFARD